jgi:uncharacterized 2Fe-2S/4Fe-4S cluster protein (DUF4445 family)
VIEVTAGAEALAPRSEREAYLRDPYRLACLAEVVDPEAHVEFSILRRRLRIVVADDDPPEAELDPVATIADGVVLYGDEPLGPVGTGLFGLAIDLGTTTIVFELVDLERGTVVETVALENPQRFGGSDVMTRISYDEADERGELQRAARKALNRELEDLYARRGIDRRDVVEAVVAANSTMRDLFFRIDVSSIGQRPYRSVTEHDVLAGRSQTTALTRRAFELGLRIHPQGRVWGPPLVASHVGADMAADLVALDVDGRDDAVTLVVDVGTNTEVVLAAHGRIVAASCPAGPAFEGGEVTYGMQGADGAIESVRLRGGGGFEVDTIGGSDPRGICGSGFVDLLAELRRADLMSVFGVFASGASEIVVEPRAGITLSRADASALAQAKAANAAGQWIVLRHAGVDPEDVDRAYLCGGFASYVDVENAIEIGFLAPVQPERVVKAGNASVRGARKLLLSRGARERLGALVRRIEHVELELAPDFFEIFVEGCQFKPLPRRLIDTEEETMTRYAS